MVTLVIFVVGLSTTVLLSEYGWAMLIACRISPQNISLGHHTCFGEERLAMEEVSSMRLSGSE